MGQALTRVNGETVVSLTALVRSENGPDGGRHMFVEEWRRAIMASPLMGLDDLSKAVWQAYGAGALDDVDAGSLCEAIAARRVVSAPGVSISAYPKWGRSGSRPRTSASLERRRSWAAGSWVPPALAAGFTQAENAVLAVIIHEIAITGRCGLPMGAVAARAGVCITSARNAVREARRSGLLHVEERRLSYDRNLPNLITVASRELALWMRTRARVEGQRGGVKSVSPTTNHIFPSSMRLAEPLTKKVSRRREKAWPSARRMRA